MKRNVFAILLFLLAFTWLPIIGIGQLGFGSTRRAGGNFSQYLINKQVESGTSLPANDGKTITRFNDLPGTVGRQFFSDVWLSGDSLADNTGQVYSGQGLSFNYDMVSGSLIASADKKNLTAVDRNTISAFTLVENGSHLTFIQIPAIEPRQYFLLLASTSSGLHLYKKCSAEFKKADFKSDGISQQGSREDRFVDKSSYYLFHSSTGHHNLVSMKSKNIQVLPLLHPFRDKVDAYLRGNKGKVTEQSLVKMFESLEN